jgi:hypothetical protein
VLYVPNAGHNLQERTGDGRPDRSRAILSLAAFVRHQVLDNPMPVLHWQHRDAGDKLSLRVEAKPAPRAARLWLAEAPSPDMRKARWMNKTVLVEKGTIKTEVLRPARGYLAFYAELDYQMDGLPYHLSTQLRLVGH